MRQHRTLGQIFAAPLTIGALSTVGLVAALVGDGWWDALSWLSLALPVALYFVFILRGGRSGASLQERGSTSSAGLHTP